MAEFWTSHGRVQRVVSVFDNETEQLVAEYPLASFDLKEFKRQFGVPDSDEDSEMVMEYTVGPDDVEFLSSRLSKMVGFDFESHTYTLSCYQAE